MIEMKHVNFAYKQTPILKDINLTIKPDEIYAIRRKTIRAISRRT